MSQSTLSATPVAPTTANKIDIRAVETAKDRKAFIRLANAIYADDKAYVAPLEFEIGARLDPTKNPVLKRSAHKLWIAYKDGAPVGRIAALVNQAHLERHHDQTGHFGFFETINDIDVARELLSTAESWLKSQGMQKIAGPYNFSVNEEMGLLVDGFDTRPYVMMPHARPYYRDLLEGLSYQKAMDVFALEYIPRRQFIPEKRMKFIEKLINKPKIEVRNLGPGGLKEDIPIALSIFNDAWSDNWGFVPFDETQGAHMAQELAPIIRKENIVICSIDGEPMAFGLVLPNINEAIADFGGKLLPFNWAKLLWRLKVSGVKSSRMPLMGVRKAVQGKPIGAAFAYRIIDMVNGANMDWGVTHSELSWILETNTAMLTMLTDMGGEIYKTYRIYERTL